MASCKNKEHQSSWYVPAGRRKCNYSTFNGGRRTPSPYSEVRCGACGASWRTDAAYVYTLKTRDS